VISRGRCVLELKPFVPSGEDYSLAKEFFVELGFRINWETDELSELECGGAKFLLQNYHNQEMQENLMMQVVVDDLDDFWGNLNESGVLARFESVRAKQPTDFPWGREVHLIDPAGVCWHFAGSSGTQ
jgi:hypothetical protein